MIGDGQGFNNIKGTDYFSGTPAPYASFPVQFGVTTYSASNNFDTNPSGYDPDRMWTDPEYATSNSTDSAAAATAMYTGEKVLNGAVNWRSTEPLSTIFDIAAHYGKGTGAVSSVQISHASPAAVGAHNISRSNYTGIANEMIYDSHLDVIMGAGHPGYDNNGQAADMSHKYVGGPETWKDLTDGDGANGFTFIETKAAFESLAGGSDNYDKVIGIAQVNSTLQYDRSTEAPNTNVPSLQTMTEAALNVLDNDPDGFALMIEGGAIDWANHGNDLERAIEEQTDFNNAVLSVMRWIESESSWEDTLLIVTADHETGNLWGEGAAFTEITDNDAGNLPGAKYYSRNHTNALVPLFAKGSGSEMFADLVDGTDPEMVTRYGLVGFDGRYIDNTDIFTVMNRAMAPVPAPAAVWLFGSGVVGLIGISRRRKPLGS